MDSSPPGSSVHEIPRGRVQEWAAGTPPGDRPDPGIEPASLSSSALAEEFFNTSATWKAPGVL